MHRASNEPSFPQNVADAVVIANTTSTTTKENQKCDGSGREKVLEVRKAVSSRFVCYSNNTKRIISYLLIITAIASQRERAYL